MCELNRLDKSMFFNETVEMGSLLYKTVYNSIRMDGIKIESSLTDPKKWVYYYDR